MSTTKKLWIVWLIYAVSFAALACLLYWLGIHEGFAPQAVMKLMSPIVAAMILFLLLLAGRSIFEQWIKNIMSRETPKE